jgi:hypothetical protein
MRVVQINLRALLQLAVMGIILYQVCMIPSPPLLCLWQQSWRSAY